MIRRLVLITVVACLSGGCTTTVRQHPDFAANPRIISSVAILPPDVEVVEISLDGDTQKLPENEGIVRDHLVETLPSMLTERGYEYIELTEDQIESAELAFDLSQLKTTYASISEDMYLRPMISKKDAFATRKTIGPAVNRFSELAMADALLIVSYGGFKKTAGLQVKQAVGGILLGALTGVVPIYAGKGVAMEAALVDGISGDILWADRIAGELSYKLAVKRVLRSLPKLGSPDS